MLDGRDRMNIETGERLVADVDTGLGMVVVSVIDDGANASGPSTLRSQDWVVLVIGDAVGAKNKMPTYCQMCRARWLGLGARPRRQCSAGCWRPGGLDKKLRCYDW